MSVAAIYSWQLPWEVSAAEKSRFRRIFNRVTMTCLVLTLIIPFLPLPVKEKPIEEKQEKRIVKVLIEKKLPPPPPPVVKKVEPPKIKKPVKKAQPKPIKKVQPKKVAKAPNKPVPQKTIAPAPPKKSAKEVAAGSGLLAFQSELADISKKSSSQTLGEKSLSRSGGSASRVERSLVTKNTGRGSGGINTASLSRDVSGTGLGGRTASRVSGPAGMGAGEGGSGSGSTEGGGGRATQRDLEKIQITFDRNKSAIFSMYNRALRSSPDLQGKVVLKITIAPSGKVTDVYIVSSELADTQLEQKLIQRVKLINFGSEDVPVFTFNYPIDFYPV